MNKSTLVDIIAARRDLPRKRAEALVDLVFDQMVDALKRGERIEIRGFGSFEVRQRGPYEGRNPRSGEPIHVEAKKTPFFKAGKELRERVDRSTTPLQPDTDTDTDTDEDTDESPDDANDAAHDGPGEDNAG